MNTYSSETWTGTIGKSDNPGISLVKCWKSGKGKKSWSRNFTKTYEIPCNFLIYISEGKAENLFMKSMKLVILLHLIS